MSTFTREPKTTVEHRFYEFEAKCSTRSYQPSLVSGQTENRKLQGILAYIVRENKVTDKQRGIK